MARPALTWRRSAKGMVSGLGRVREVQSRPCPHSLPTMTMGAGAQWGWGLRVLATQSPSPPCLPLPSISISFPSGKYPDFLIAGRPCFLYLIALHSPLLRPCRLAHGGNSVFVKCMNEWKKIHSKETAYHFILLEKNQGLRVPISSSIKGSLSC